MGFRITTNMMMNTYRYNLMNSTQKRADSSDKVLTQRNFNSYAEDPAAAAQAFRLRRDFYQTSNQIASNKDVYSKFNTAHHNVQGMLDDLINPMDKISIIRGENDTSGESRTALAQILRESAESMIQGFNQQLGDQFIFAGNDGLHVPFEWKGNDLYYRGINVNSGHVPKPTAADPGWLSAAKAGVDAAAAAGTGPAWSSDDQAWADYYSHATSVEPSSTKPQWARDIDAKAKDPDATDEVKGWVAYYNHNASEPPTAEPPAWGDPGKYGIPENMPLTSGDPIEAGWIDYYNDQANVAKLQEMSEEEMYIDLGMGAKENAPNDPIRGSYFNSALSGLNYTGFGTDEDGDPKNFAILLKELADVFDTWNEDTQSYDPEIAKGSAEGLTASELKDKAMRLMDKLKLAQEKLTSDHVELNARSSYLQTNQSRLEIQASELNMDILDVEQVDLADAITNFSWDMYCYNAALKIGNQLLSQSLIDYMR